VFAGIFTSDTALVSYTAWAIRIFLACGFSVGFQISCQQAFMALGQAKISLLMACLRKIVLLIPLIFILPAFLENKVLAVFLAEPVSDIVAAAVTTFLFFRFFRKLMKTKQ
jgi:Na+-driven multidrug efflux pump